LAGIAGFVLVYAVIKLAENILGDSIPYQFPEASSQNGGLAATTPGGILVLLLGLAAFAALTAIGEEIMFRGYIQTQIGQRYGEITGILFAALLFGLRHLPNDIFYARLWQATPEIWLSRQVQLYLAALIFGLTRHYGKSTISSSICHGLYLLAVLFGLG
jgi:membrane protease YdiL (CAAX protease family)